VWVYKLVYFLSVLLTIYRDPTIPQVYFAANTYSPASISTTSISTASISSKHLHSKHLHSKHQLLYKGKCTEFIDFC
jgi:hypothetical protein